MKRQHSKSLKEVFTLTAFLFFALVIFVDVFMAEGDWREATSSPPSENPLEPFNASSSYQAKYADPDEVFLENASTGVLAAYDFWVWSASDPNGGSGQWMSALGQRSPAVHYELSLAVGAGVAKPATSTLCETYPYPGGATTCSDFRYDLYPQDGYLGRLPVGTVYGKLCEDGDGCTFGIGAGTKNGQGEIAGFGPTRLWMTRTPADTSEWKVGDPWTDYSAPFGKDGDGVLARAWHNGQPARTRYDGIMYRYKTMSRVVTCLLSERDDEWTGIDDSIGLSLIMEVSKASLSASFQTTCTLDIED